MTAPRRPALADRVRPRRHVVDGRAFVVLNDAETGRAAQIGEREWALLAAADGTRDLEGVRRAAAARGVRAKAAHVEAFFSELAALGWLEDDAPDAPEEEAARAQAAVPPAPPAPVAPAPGRPIRLLPNYSLRCDGGGSCCRLYQTILFGPLDAARARALAPDVQGAGEDPDGALLPERGARRLAVVPTFVHGRCAYLDERDLCRVHAAGGADAKPVGCRLFPLAFVDDGAEVRVGVSPECACVLESALPATDPPGEPLLDPTLATSAELPPEVHCFALPEVLERAPGVPFSRAAYLRLEAALSGRLGEAGAADDPARRAWALGGALARGDSTEDALARWDDALEAAEPALGAELAAVVERLEARVAEDAAWRAPDDLARLAVRWTLEAARRLSSAGPRAPSARERVVERFHLRALAFGHRFALGGPVSRALRAAALRLWLGRAMADHLEEAGVSEPAARHPSALVEAVARVASLP